MPIRLMTAAALTAMLIGWTAACTLEAQARPEGMFERTLAVGGPVTLDIRTGSGNIQIHRGAGDSVRVAGTVRAGRSWWWFDGDVEERIRRIAAATSRNRLQGTVRGGGARVDLSTGSGSVQVE